MRKWRDQSDPRWAQFLAERAAAGMVPVGSAGLPAPESPRAWTDEELALETQIRKMKEATADLRERAEVAKKAGDLDSELALRRMWLQHAEALRRLEKDAPGIARDSGDVVPKRLFHQTVIQYSSAIAAALANLPDRILTLLPNLEEALASKIRAEVADVQRAAKEIRLDGV
ncbi:MAG: hypothetical protein FGM22_08215 [Burkholderiaceae bacterium]|nr:hypothetical protein [Burkholderiaceae bacterium]